VTNRHLRRFVFESVEVAALLGRDGLGALSLHFSRFGQNLNEAINATLGIHELLFAREEGVAVGADFHAHVTFVRGPGLEGMTARAGHLNYVIGGVDASFHLFFLNFFTLPQGSPVALT
jgi:hypothetical protein